MSSINRRSRSAKSSAGIAALIRTFVHEHPAIAIAVIGVFVVLTTILACGPLIIIAPGGKFHIQR